MTVTEISNNFVKLSTVVQLFDGFLKSPISHTQPHFLLEDKKISGLAKSQGIFVFSNLEPGKYCMQVDSEVFFSSKFDLSVDHQPKLGNSTLVKTLLPNPLYPYPADTTLIRGLVTDAKNGCPLINVQIDANYRTARGKPKQAGSYSFNAGRYALHIPGKLLAQSEIVMTFKKTGYSETKMKMSIRKNQITFFNTQMNPS